MTKTTTVLCYLLLGLDQSNAFSASQQRQITPVRSGTFAYRRSSSLHQSSRSGESSFAKDVSDAYRSASARSTTAIEHEQSEYYQHPELYPAQAIEESELTAEAKGEKEIMFARMLLIAAAALYGTNFSLVKLMGESDLPVGLSTTLRFGLAALATSPWLFAPSKTEVTEQDTNPRLGAAIAGFEVGCWTSIGYISQAVGLETTLASKSAFLCSLAVVVVPFLEFLSGRRLKTREWVGAAMALAGVAFLELGGDAGDMFATWTRGDIASMIQPFAFGMGFYRMERAMTKYPNEANRSTAAQLLATAVLAATFCAITEGVGVWNMEQLQIWLSDPTILAFLAWTGLASTALSVYMETVALKTLSASETTLLLSTEPLWGAGFAAFIIGEQFGVDAYVGGFLVLVGCLYSNLGLKGLQKLINRNKEQPQVEASATTTAGKITTTTQNQPAVPANLGSAMIMAAGVAGAWNNLSIGARVALLQIQDFVEEIL